jgi:2-polyprenyl-3-methyl-5-hydroxy-6-metoxy-1,4-benzoquinol methylase
MHENPPNGADTERPLRLEYQQCCLCGVEDADPIAVGEDFEYRTCPDTFVVMRCRHCRLVFLNPRPAREELGRIYPPTYHAFEFTPEKYGLAHRVRSWLESRRLLAYCNGLGETARILDIGCGDGFHLKLLKKYGRPGWRVEGIDASEQAVAAATGQGLDVHLGAIESAELDEGAYDLVLLIATIEHVEDPPGVLSAAARLLRPGGRAVVVTDNTGTLDFRIFGDRHWGGYHFPRHWNLFNKQTLARLAEHAGLRVTRLGTNVSPVNWVYSIHIRLRDRGAPDWLINRFTLKSPGSLGVFTIVDNVMRLFGRGALLTLIARKGP